MCIRDRCRMVSESTMAFAVTWICYGSFYLTRKPFSVLKATLGRSPPSGGLGLSTNQLGLIDSAFLASYAFAQLFLGPMGDRLGARPMLTTMLTVTALSTAAMGLFTSPAALGLLMAVNGTAQSAGYALCMKALIPHLDVSTRATTLGWWTTCQTVGGIAATMLAAATLTHFGWRVVFLLPGVLVLGSALLVAGFLPRTKEPSSAPGLPSEGPPAAPVSLLATARIPYLLHLGLAYFFVKLIRYTLIMWLPYYLASELGYTESSAGYSSTLYDIGGTAGTIAGGIIADKLAGGMHVAVALPAIAAATTIIMNFRQLGADGDGLGLAAGMMALGFLIAIPDCSLGGVATVNVCARNGARNSKGENSVLATALSLNNSIAAVGPILQGSLTPLIAAQFGWDGVFKGMAVTCGLACLILLPVAADEWKAPSSNAGGSAASCNATKVR
eukprot:TRINITY_DN44520_c0_g1_i2.p1 TRINITY_DN44520_c0_g1~~TRINITY_DN44520_c0_g1_i2.p1  ORF type:complete len:483 (+),score=66.77 TRINITY_DN44520_c0_g1_i2:118-1449(+)